MNAIEDILALASVSITVPEVQAGLGVFPPIYSAIVQKLANPTADVNAVEAIVSAAADIGVPDASIVLAAIKILVLIWQHNQSMNPVSATGPGVGGRDPFSMYERG